MLNYRVPLQKMAGCALCCVAAAAAFAGTPPGASPGGLLGRASGLLAATPAHPPAAHLDFQRLDLRPPETLSSGRDSAATFPSVKHTLGSTSGSAEDAASAGSANLLRMENKVQELERRVPREGLPLARLWETKTALLHVGLSPKGKPGLWLIQKVP
jgi:hypothetical protein